MLSVTAMQTMKREESFNLESSNPPLDEVEESKNVVDFSGHCHASQPEE